MRAQEQHSGSGSRWGERGRGNECSSQEQRTGGQGWGRTGTAEAGEGCAEFVTPVFDPGLKVIPNWAWRMH